MTVSTLSFGGGVNSTALLLWLMEQSTPPTVVMFADTGGEKPGTYQHVAEVSARCAKAGLPFVTVSNGNEHNGATLEANCLRRKELPSLAYGFKGCSAKWKRQPMDRWLRQWQPAVEAWARGEKVTRYIGIDAGEPNRAKLPPDARFVYRYPLAENGIDRDECVEIIRRHGLSVPPKSSCFFCPAMRKDEIVELGKQHPDLLSRALAIEANSAAHTVKGLGRNWSWAGFLEADARQGKLFPETMQQPCGCHDGDDDDAEQAAKVQHP